MHPETPGEHSNTLMLAHVKYIHLWEDMLTDGSIVDLAKFKPVARMEDITYARVGGASRMR